MAKLMVLCLAVLAAAISNVGALSKEEFAKIEKDMMVVIRECAEKFDVSESELKKAKEDHDIDSVDPCLLGCFFKTTKVINDKGLYDPDMAIENSRIYMSQDEDKAKVVEIAKDCAKVNDESVSDGEEGCERSKLLLACLGTHKQDLMPTF